MSQKIQLERDCTEKCKSLEHGDLISSVITKREVSDEELCAYIRWLCSACGQVCDSMGRTALHFAASCGRTKLVKWLIQNKGALINAKDLESGYTALHRSIFYGNINVTIALIKLGANMNLTDHNDLTPLEHAMKDKMSEKYSKYLVEKNNQIYVWGTNTNYTLGTGSQHSRQYPELNDAFHKNYPNESVQQICLEKFHCVIITEEEYESIAYACGHGQGGRLGLNTEKTVLVPQKINFPKHRGELFQCKAASIGRDHSMFLSKHGIVMTCGLNTHHVLGVKPPPKKLLVPTSISLNNQAADGICAGRYHSVAWGSTFIYTWGLHAGQLGHPLTNNISIISPKLVTHFNSSDEIVSVAVSDGATVVATKKGDVFALHEYQCRKIASRQLNIAKIVVVGGHLNPKLSSDLTDKGGKELKVIVLLNIGNLLIWQESWPQISRCIFNLNRPLIAIDVVLSRTELYFVTKDGEAFKGDFRTRKKKQVETNEKKSAFHEFLDKDDCQVINVTKFPHIHRAIEIECDLKGTNFACIQNAPQIYTLDGEKFSSSTLQLDMLNLLNNAEEMDNIHDGIFQVSGQIFPVHKYIIAIKSDVLYSLLEANKDSIIDIPNIHPYLFKQILTYIYTSMCDFIQIGNLSTEVINFCAKYKNNENKIEMIDDKKQKNKKNLNINNPLAILQQAAKRFGIKCLSKIIDKLSYNNGQLRPKNEACYFDNYFHLEFDRLLYPNLCDVTIKSENGEEIHAHKCILSRLEYFNSLFAVRWNKDSSESIVSLPVSLKTLKAIVEFLYTDNPLKNVHDLDHLCNVLVISDQLFIENLKEMCEKYLSDLITLRNVPQMLKFSYVYNACDLKYNCINFINHNLAALLELRSLEILDEEILNDLTRNYCYKDVLSKRVITPYSYAPTDEEVKSIFEMFPVNLEDLDQENYEKKTPKLGIRKKIRTRKSSSSDNRNKSLSESFESNNSFTEEVEEIEVVDKTSKDNKPDTQWIKILTDKEKHQKIVQNRLKAINSAKIELESENINPNENFTKLVSSQNMTSPLPSPKNESIKSPTINDVPIQKVPKLSQKQRKKLAAELSIPSMAHDLEKINKKPSWNTIVWSKENNSFSDIIKNEKVKDFPELNVGSSSPKNPWQKVEIPSPIASPETKQNFKDIVADEKKLKENWTKMRDRPLIYIQMEDKAISDLEKFYNIDQVSDEYITIHKVEKGCFAVPLWVQTNKH